MENHIYFQITQSGSSTVIPPIEAATGTDGYKLELTGLFARQKNVD